MSNEYSNLLVYNESSAYLLKNIKITINSNKSKKYYKWFFNEKPIKIPLKQSRRYYSSFPHFPAFSRIFSYLFSTFPHKGVWKFLCTFTYNSVFSVFNLQNVYFYLCAVHIHLLQQKYIFFSHTTLETYPTSVTTHFLITFLWHVKLKCIFNSRLSMLCRFHIDKWFIYHISEVKVWI